MRHSEEPVSTGPLDPAAAASQERRRAVLIVVDGVRYDRLTAARTPAVDSLGRDGLLLPSLITDTAMTLPVSGPGHSTLLTGVWPDKHRVFNNDFTGHRLADHQPLFARLASARPDLTTLTSADWEPLNTFLLNAATEQLVQPAGDFVKADHATADNIVAALRSDGPDLLYAYFHQVDATGHAQGSDSAEYGRAIERVDTHIGEILAAVRARPSSEEWLVIVSTDHGQTGNRHGGDEETTRTAWIAALGPSLNLTEARKRSWRQVDLVPTLLRYFDVEIDPAWDLDGVAIGTVSTDPLDTVPLPAGTPSTGDVPDGWSREDRTSGEGDPWFRGWRLMRRDHWAAGSEPGGRGSFVRGRDIIAVADPERWGAGGFDSTITSSWTPVEAGGRAAIEYFNHYRQGAVEGLYASVFAEFDDGSVVTLWEGAGPESVLSVPVSFAVECPAQARNVRFAWRLVSAATTGYWAFGEPLVTIG